MRSTILCVILLSTSPHALRAQDFKMEPGPKSPADSLKCMTARPGFKVELMASEPLVMDPIAFAWGPDGKFWVVEMGDYPLGVDSKNKAGGRIKYLEKTKPDGPYDKMTLFMDNLGYPTGVFPYANGVLVTCAPDIFYAEVGKDGKLAKKEMLFTGFKEGNQQHRVNGLTWGIDNWIYGANGDSGGVVKSIKTGKTVNISGRDFRLKVETGEFETVSGQSQFGRCRDDWGNWFGNNNSNPMFHYVLEDRYLKRNPHVLYPDVRVQVPVKPGAQPVYPISKPLPRFNSPQALNNFTSACSTIIYRDTLFGKEFEGNMFVSEPVHNLIHREIVKPKGVTFTSQRADDEQTSEFLASSDNWFRPAMIQVGPDGALWVADMYRYVIEHPEWIPKDWQKKLDLRAGHDMGRVYRVYPESVRPREMPRLEMMTTEQLDDTFSSPNGWVRDAAHQLLFAHVNTMNQKDLGKLADSRLRSRAHRAYKTPQAKLHAHYAYERLHREYPALIPISPSDTEPALRKHYLLPDDENSVLSEASFKALAKDESSQVRQQLAYNLGRNLPSAPHYPQALARLLSDNAEDRYIVAAGLSSINKDNWKPVLSTIESQNIPDTLVGPMVRLATAFGEKGDAALLFLRQLETQSKLPMNEQIAYTAKLIELAEKNGVTLKSFLEDQAKANVAKVRERLQEIYSAATQTVSNAKAPMADRLTAMRLLGRGLGDDRADHKLLLSFLTPQTPDDVQGAVIQQIGGAFDPRVPTLLLTPWKSYSPALRGQVLDILLARPLWARLTLETVQKKQIPAQEIDAVRRQRLLLHKDAQIRAQAREIFAAASSSDRGKVIDLYWLQMPENGDAKRGAKLFAKSCAICHKLGDVGQNVGPDLASVGDKSPQGLLAAILDPNKALESRYINYLATTKKGLTHSGILSAETSTTITLTANDGKTHQLLRNELEDLASTGKSLMPEGLEKDLSPQDMADVIALVRANLAAPKRKEFPGNTPAAVSPDKDGRLHLSPKTASIYGPSLVLEKQYGNLGYWTKADDQVIWTIDVPAERSFTVWIDFACATDSEGNTLIVTCGTEKLSYKVERTGTWDAYQLQSIGKLQIPAGKHEIVLRGEAPIRGALLDLKAVELRPR